MKLFSAASGAGILPVDRRGLSDTSRLGRVLIVSNRLPVTVELDGATVALKPSSGGLATGLRPVHEGSSSMWIGWPGIPAEVSCALQREVRARLAERAMIEVPLSQDEIVGFYQRVASSVLWPLLHNDASHPEIRPDDWTMYQAVNTRFADVVARELLPSDLVWIHDYHLMLLPRLLRSRHPEVRIGFFLHTPFPEARAFTLLAQGAALLDGMLGADVIGFHTPAYAKHFAETMHRVLGRRVEWTGTGVCDDGERVVCLQANPMGVDAAALATRAADPRVGSRVAALRAAGRPLFVGIDRLDPTKGILQRLMAFSRLLESRPELRGRARLFQLAVPSRVDVRAYRVLRGHVEGMVEQLNARLGTADWTPVEYLYGCVDETELAALYRAADVMLVTSLRDGMNLVAKEFVASCIDHDGVLILSEHAGAAAELRHALLVDPNDIDRLAGAYAAALDMSPAERRLRMRHLQACVRARDVRCWANECLGTLGATRLGGGAPPRAAIYSL